MLTSTHTKISCKILQWVDQGSLIEVLFGNGAFYQNSEGNF